MNALQQILALRRRRIFHFARLAIFLVAATQTRADADSSPDLFNQSLQSLMQIQVTIAKGTPETVADTAAAVSVITHEDIARSGATTIPDILRLVPGLDVARLDAHTWAVSARGFNGPFANKLLVMIDGRTVYTPLFSGVFWDVQDTLLEDIDRIEVVRGPGASLWGANAVDGVINIITKSAADTQGGLVSGGGGTQEGDFGEARYGTQVADGVFMRAYAKYFNRDGSNLPRGSGADDAWSMLRGGFRMDVNHTNQNFLTLQGDVYSGNEHETYMVFPAPVVSVDNVAGGNLMGDWKRDFSDDSQLDVRLYYDRTVRNTAIFSEERDTYDLNAQHNFHLGSRQEITYGADYRFTSGNITDSRYIAFADPDRSLSLYSAFAQDDIALVETNLHLTLGSKFERNDFTGFEIQPSARLTWTPTPRQTIWGSISRAVRTPSEAEEDIILRVTPIPVVGNPNMLSEEMLAYEVGYRISPADYLTFDVTAFYDHYDRLRSEAATLGPNGPELEVSNGLKGDSYGGELAATWQAAKFWRWQGGYSYCQIDIDGSDLAGTQELMEGSTPRSQFYLRSSLDLCSNVTFDATLRYVDALSLPYTGLPDYTHIPSYVTYDLRVAWAVSRHFEVSIVGQNLGQAQHLESAPTYIPTEQTAVLRSVYGKVTFKF